MRPTLSVVVAFWAAASALAPAQEPRRGATYVPGEVIVKLKDIPTGGISVLSQSVTALSRQQAVLARLQARYGMHDAQPVFPRIHARALQGLQVASFPNAPLRLLPYYVLRTDRNVAALCAELSRDADVQYAQPNYIYHICRDPNDPDFPDQYAHQLIQMEKAWDISTGSRDIVIGILGTGVDVNHPDLQDNIWTNAAEIPGNKVDDDNNGFVDDVHGWNFDADNNALIPIASSSSISSHETQVAGVVGAVGNNGTGVVGVNWQCSMMVLRVSLSLTSKEVAAALDYATANGARVVNMSFGGEFSTEEDRLTKTAVDNACAQGVLLVASAGNSNSSFPYYPASYSNVLSVASTNGEDAKTDHSSFGPWVDIAAPGTDIVTTNLNGNYIATAGTSFSSPYVAAVATLVLAHRPNLTSIQLRAILENTADPVYYGDVDPNLGYVGTGRVNAFRALQNADLDYPLGQIVAPMPRQTFAADANALELCVLVHGDSYQLDYRPFGATAWTPIALGPAPADPNGLVCLPLARPGVGSYELRLAVHRGGLTHTDRTQFGIRLGPDQPSWPKPRAVGEYLDEYFIGNPLCLDLDGDGRNEVLQASLDYSDPSSYYGGGKVNLWGEDGNSLPGWPVTFDYAWPSSVAAGDIDGDGDFEAIVACEFDGQLYAYHAETGRIVDGNWPVVMGSYDSYIAAPPVLVDLNGDGVSEILVALDAESRQTDGLYAIRSDGTFLWQRRYTSNGPITVADINRDGKPEICLSGYGPGLDRVYTFILDSQGQQMTRWRGGSDRGTVVADLDGDGTFELIFCTDEDVQAVRPGGSTVWKAKVPPPFDAKGGLCASDLDGDGFSEVFVNTYVEAEGFIYSQVYAFDHRGKPLTAAGFPKTLMGDPTRCIPLIADLDGDGANELVVGGAYEPLMAWEADGSVTPGFPALNLNPDVEITPTVADLDQDGDLELMLAADDYRFHVVDLPGTYAADQIAWGMARHDPQNSGWTAPVARLDPVGAPPQIKPGQRLQGRLAVRNPANLPLRWTVGNLPQGAYYDTESHTLFWKPAVDQAFGMYTVSFLVTDGIRQDSRSVSLTVVPDAIYAANMDTDPGWTLDPGWAWGTPTGQGSWNGDPSVGHTGAKVLGYALEGDYADNLAETHYATTGPIDCRGYENIRLSFWRWLGIEAPYDYACVQVSNDGESWTNLWTTGVSHISDDAWQFAEYTVPATIADDGPTVYFRWGLGPTDDSVACPGWNLDDVQVTGDRQ